MRRGLAVVTVACALGLVAAVPPPGPPVTLTLDAPLPDRNWTIKLTNTGTDAIRIVADPRLFSFDVKTAGHEHHCALPADMVPTTDTSRTIAMPPGRSWSARVDPLLYCFNTTMGNALAPGAEIVAHFGWPQAHYAPPFAVTPLGASDAGVSPAREVIAAPVTIAPVVVATSPEGGAVAPDAGPPSHPDAYPVHLRVTMGDRLDISNTFEQTVNVTVSNEGDRPVHTLLGAETIGFAIDTPSGASVRCGALSPLAAFVDLTTSLAPHGRHVETVDLGSKCGASMRVPGLYRLRPRLDTRLVTPPAEATSFWNGEVIGPPMLVRVRGGEEPLPLPRLDPP